MLETILNLLWLIVTLAALWLWRFRWLASRRNPRARVFVEVVAMGCALALLFPVISLTDDLHPEIVAVDACSGKRNSCLTVSGIARAREITPVPSVHSLLAVLRPPSEHIQPNIAEIVLLTENFRPLMLGGRVFGRSPPPLQ